jgi:3-deoxy-D-manno-octulosonic-acid transferase
MTGALAPLVLLVAADEAAVAPLRVLAGELANLREAPRTELRRPGEGDGRLPAGTALLVVAGEPLPADLIAAAAAQRAGPIWIEAGPAPRLDRRGLWPGRLRRCLAAMAEIHARDAAAAQALVRIVGSGVPVLTTGLLARHPPAPPCNEAELEVLRAAVAGRPVWLAHSLPETEFDAALAAHVAALRQAHRLVLIAAPRDPRQGPALAARAAALGLETARRLADEPLAPTTQVYVADAEDDPGLFLRLAPVTWLGGSLTPGLGSPPALLAAALGTALVVGPEGREGFVAALCATGAARRIARAADMGPAVAALIAPEAGAAAALQAWMLATQGADVTQTVVRAIRDWLALNAGAAGAAAPARREPAG